MSQYDEPTRPKSAPSREGNVATERRGHGLSISADPTLQSSIDGPRVAVPPMTADNLSAESGFDRRPTPTKSPKKLSKDTVHFVVASENRHISSSEVFHSLNANTTCTRNPLAVDDDVSQDVQSDLDDVAPNSGKMAGMPTAPVQQPCASLACTANAHELPRESPALKALQHLKKSYMPAPMSCHTLREDLEERLDVDYSPFDGPCAVLEALTQNEFARGRRRMTGCLKSRVARVVFGDGQGMDKDTTRSLILLATRLDVLGSYHGGSLRDLSTLLTLEQHTKSLLRCQKEQKPPHDNHWQSEPSLRLTGKLILELTVMMQESNGLALKQVMQDYAILHKNVLERHGRRPLGIHFSLNGTTDGDTKLHPAIDFASKKLSVYKSKKRQGMSSLLDHQATYKPYTEITSAKVRSQLVQIARSFTDMDELFAAMFVQVIEASDVSTLGQMLKDIRHEISIRQASESSSKDDQDIYLGDLGQHCESLLKHYGCVTSALDLWSKPHNIPSVPEFRNRKGSEQSLLEYLQDGFELPYWKVMLDAFSTSRSHQVTLGGNLVATSLVSMRSKVCSLRCKLQTLLDSLPDQESVDDILVVIDKRIKLLHSFTDRVVSDTDDDDGIVDHILTTSSSPLGRANSLNATIISIAMEGREHSSTTDPLLLVTLVLLTLIIATVPFVLGFKASNETGAFSDADFWYNISSSIFTIMANFAMIVQLTRGARFSRQYLFVWIWFFLGVACAVVSVAIYPVCNTAWSSLLSFFATIAGFGATLSVAMTVAKPRSDEPLAKKKVE